MAAKFCTARSDELLIRPHRGRLPAGGMEVINGLHIPAALAVPVQLGEQLGADDASGAGTHEQTEYGSIHRLSRTTPGVGQANGAGTDVIVRTPRYA